MSIFDLRLDTEPLQAHAVEVWGQSRADWQARR
ncbi:hypothetical protein XTALMG727_0674 [Xanthomonas translucens pv. arrhenatheri LMG 727]|uniref:Uncharacterized protein n=1 Tax=Xanthomonas graminis pv. arrhenatheri LMG 727 TaxID=1195923 RepID=A0A0K2ZF86_9XANT|nr:hypothetical protein XTALMG727_0674 [Xanthomonas translucens pv. arrhenatheri LMG 727]